MLFQSIVPSVFSKISIDFSSRATQARKKLHAKRLDAYHGQQLAALEEELLKYFADPAKLQKMTINVTKKITDNLASIYRTAPVRELDSGTEADQKVYKSICGASKIDLRLKQASRYAKLLKSLLIRVAWRKDATQIDLVTGNLLDVATGETPDDLKEILITDYGDSGKIQDVEYSHWTAERFERLDYRGQVIFGEDNPYHVLPFIPIFDSLPVGSDFWLPGGEDLDLAQSAINVKLTDLLHILLHQSFGVGWIKGRVEDPLENDSEPLLYGPGSLIELQGKESGLGFESQNANISMIINSIDRLIKWTCVSHGLSAATMSTDAAAESGLSKIWGSAELSEKRSEDKALWKSYEAELFDLIKVVHNTHSPEKLSPAATLSVDFADPSTRPATSMLDEAEANLMYYNMGVFSPVDIIMKKDSDLTSREQAMERLALIKREREALAPPIDNDQASPASSSSHATATMRQTRR